MTATERFKRMFADAVERVCVLEAENEQLRAQLAQLTPEPEDEHAERLAAQAVDNGR